MELPPCSSYLPSFRLFLFILHFLTPPPSRHFEAFATSLRSNIVVSPLIHYFLRRRRRLAAQAEAEEGDSAAVFLGGGRDGGGGCRNV